MTQTVVSPGPEPPPEPHARPWGSGQGALSALGLIALVASALFGGNAFGVREHFLGSETPPARPPAASRAAGASGAADEPAATTVEPARTVLRSQPWWQSVTKLEGVGTMTAPAFTIDPGAVQWRVKWTCQTGRLMVRAPAQRRPVVDAACPGADTGYGIQKGSVGLQVRADGPWQLQVDQQVDLPLNEPVLPAMTAPGAAAVATGSLYRIDQVGSGTVTLYRLGDGGYALRLADFFLTANTDLEVQLSPLEAPRSTDQVKASNPVSVAALDITAGSLNFVLPPTVDPTRYKSVVIWCERLFSAYAAASLRPA